MSRFGRFPSTGFQVNVSGAHVHCGYVGVGAPYWMPAGVLDGVLAAATAAAAVVVVVVRWSSAVVCLGAMGGRRAWSGSRRSSGGERLEQAAGQGKRQRGLQ